MSDDTIEAFGRKWKRVWQEDETTRNDPTAEHLLQAWKRLFNEEYPGSKNAPKEDHGDTFYYLLAGRVYVMAYDGASIYVPASVTADEDPHTAMAREFHQRMGLVTRDAPSLGTPAEREERVRLMLEELLEFAGALGVTVLTGRAGALEMKDVAAHADSTPSITSALHELADLQVTVSGTAVQFGLPLLAAAREVHRANMEKTPQGPGRKPLKPEGWKPADVSKVLTDGGES